jgi:FMN-dependent NADH-azoreductase
MTRIIRIDTSSRLQGSQLRELADIFQAAWLKQNLQDEVIVRNLTEAPNDPFLMTKLLE